MGSEMEGIDKWFFTERIETGLFSYSLIFVVGNLCALFLIELEMLPSSFPVILSIFQIAILITLSFILLPIIRGASYSMFLNIRIYLCLLMFLTGFHNPFTHKIQRESQITGDEISIRTIVEDVKITKKGKLSLLISIGSERSYIYTDSYRGDILPGDTIQLTATFRDIENFSQEFDYKKYLRRRGVLSSTYIRSDNISLSPASKLSIKYIIKRYRREFTEAITELFREYDALPIIIALSTGDRSQIDETLSNSFRNSGAMHILALSGLHIGILYKTLSLFLGILGNTLPSRRIKSAIILSLLWSFAIFTSLSPSIFRAVLMATIYELSRYSTNQGNGINSLSLSLLIIILLNPYSIFDAGLQLSFSAMAGIFFIAPFIQSAVTINNSIISYIWDLISVTISCQITTLPFTLSYFGYFPSLFIITNLAVIPVINIVMILLLLRYMLIFSPVLSQLLTFLLIKSLDILTIIVKYLGSI